MGDVTYTLSPGDLARCREINLRHRDRVKEIALAVCAETSVPMSSLYGPGRRIDVVRARWLVMYLAYQDGLTMQAIGDAMNRDHSSVLHGIRKERERRGECQ